jgi:hypothetical protein
MALNGISKNSKSWMCGVDEKLYFPMGNTPELWNQKIFEALRTS